MIEQLKRFFLGGSLGKIVDVAAWAAALVPLALWFVRHKDAPLVVVSYGDAIFWGAIIWAIVMAGRVSTPPRWTDRYR